MKEKEYIEKRNKLLDMLEADSCGDIFLDNFQRTGIINELDRLDYEWFMRKKDE